MGHPNIDALLQASLDDLSSGSESDADASTPSESSLSRESAHDDGVIEDFCPADIEQAKAQEGSTYSVSQEEEEEEEDDDDDDVDVSVASSARNLGRANKDSEKQIRAMAKSEDRRVRASRIVVLVILLIVGAALATTTYIILRNQEQDDLSHTFELIIKTIEDNVRFQSSSIDKELLGLAEQLTVESLRSQTFPSVTLPFFEVAGASVRSNTVLSMVSFAPLVTDIQREQWQAYSVANQGWVLESQNITTITTPDGEMTMVDEITPYIFSVDEAGVKTEAPRPGPYLALWQLSPPPSTSRLINLNLFSLPNLGTLFLSMASLKHGVSSRVMDVSVFVGDTNGDGSAWEQPHSLLMEPVYLNLDKTTIAGALMAVVPWDDYVAKLLPKGIAGLLVVLENSKGQALLYGWDGEKAVRVTNGALMEDANALSASIELFSGAVDEHLTVYSLRVYVSSEFVDNSTSSIPVVFAVFVAVAFLLVVAAFVVYDRYVKRRNDKVVGAAARTNAIVANLFPTTVHERLFGKENEVELQKSDHQKKKDLPRGVKKMLDFSEQTSEPGEEFADDLVDDEMDDVDNEIFKTKPIADLFPDTTIMFADIAGFTAWSSTREPSQVFTLLETVYRAFDKIAKQRGVFKVETIGDCYVAVTGLPEPRKDHAIVMSRFARDCMRKMDQLTKLLEVRLGPDTGDLCMRIGLHSGPVTAGVLRGERSRFQLFGDTMNTASRHESTGEKGRIQISQATADLLSAAGKGKWYRPREEKVYAKGKGEIQTYWLKMKGAKSRKHVRVSAAGTTATSVVSEFSDSDDDSDFTDSSFEDDDADFLVQTMVNPKTSRLIDWNVEVLLRLLKQVVAQRRLNMAHTQEVSASRLKKITSPPKGETVIKEVQEIINLPPFDPSSIAVTDDDIFDVQLDAAVVEQLHDLVTNLAIMYRDNPFHNFEHASHVAMCVVKHMARIVAGGEGDFAEKEDDAAVLHQRAYGITSDPLTQFACVFSALIHDVDHSGVPNSQLVKEGVEIAKYYNGQSVAEQNSVDLAWGLLMDDNYSDLRAALCGTEEEWKRFRHLVVNSVMATDIMDRGLKELRDGRWEKAFAEFRVEEPEGVKMNRKATIVIEHLIQASDIAHTMQHWEVYRKWNERLFMEMYKAFREGRAEKDPSEFWYEGEMKFYDFYIIPLAKKLKECGVFGVSSDEGLDYALKNRREWEDKGEKIVEEMREKFEQTLAPKTVRPTSTLKIGNNDVTTTSVTAALSTLMMQVQQMEQAETAFSCHPR